jgi:Spy/CpxP family protein refolding chaperone
MKTSFCYVFLLGAALIAFSLQTTLAQDSASPSQTAPSTGSTNAGVNGTPTAGQGHHFRAILAQLDLTEAQKEQIKQIRATVTDRKERHQQVLAVLTPEQKAKLRELIQTYRSGSQGGSSTTSTGTEAP